MAMIIKTINTSTSNDDDDGDDDESGKYPRKINMKTMIKMVIAG